MNGIIKSFKPLLKRVRKYSLEIILLSIALLIIIVVLVIYNKNTEENIDQEFSDNNRSDKILPKMIFVDVSGAVKKPNIYKVDFGTRIKDVIDKAGGLSDEADAMFFNRNFNLARVVSDQEKIYIPSAVEINNGIFIQNQRTLDYNSPSITYAENTLKDSLSNNQLININIATIEELDQLPGVGSITANKIIANQPYSMINELLSKKVVNKGVFDKIKDLISVD